MDNCIDCKNCKMNQSTYFCIAKNDFVIDDKLSTQEIEKNRSGWKKGDPSYEIHRRKSRKEAEAL